MGALIISSKIPSKLHAFPNSKSLALDINSRMEKKNIEIIVKLMIYIILL